MGVIFLQVAPFLRDCKSRGYRRYRRAGKNRTENERVYNYLIQVKFFPVREF